VHDSTWLSREGEVVRVRGRKEERDACTTAHLPVHFHMYPHIHYARTTRTHTITQSLFMLVSRSEAELVHGVLPLHSLMSDALAAAHHLLSCTLVEAIHKAVKEPGQGGGEGLYHI